MSGITFFSTKNLEKIKEFYTNRIDMDLWLDQGGCIILKHGNMLLGFCEGGEIDKGGTITFFYEDKKKVDQMYKEFEDSARSEPKENEKFHIYNFFAEDIEGRTIEFQTFLHPIKPYLGGEELLRGRRSVRNFKDKEVPEEILSKIFEACRFSPTSHNAQGYYFIPICDREVIKFMASRRGGSSKPIQEAPMAIAVCCDPEETLRPIQDGCIAAYHFILTAWAYGLGTCWIAAMDREDVKEKLGIPKDHYVVTVTPLGFPQKIPKTPSRKPKESFIKKEL